jgi:hypothetical protein
MSFASVIIVKLRGQVSGKYACTYQCHNTALDLVITIILIKIPSISIAVVLDEPGPRTASRKTFCSKAETEGFSFPCCICTYLLQRALLFS